MATLTVRQVPDEIVERLKLSASRNRRSMEQEVRELLAQRFASWEALEHRIRARKKAHGGAMTELIDA